MPPQLEKPVAMWTAIISVSIVLFGAVISGASAWGATAEKVRRLEASEAQLVEMERKLTEVAEAVARIEGKLLR